MKLSIVIPAYNEEIRIIKTLDATIDFFNEMDQYEIIVVDDGSIDNTKNVINELHVENIKIIEHTENFGKGKAIKTGVENAIGEKILIMESHDCIYRIKRSTEELKARY